ncbi:hypothetical protein BpHYR1_003596 [Brachionus plicatilis]|uniref:Uncharacterized protein n=1 Tax=Brachionus plicatilis TaxID=10195 RepID=A0A3M7RRH6_BRAPC|nr:hypothetical protein BpHYR1_003596 [Brachionus plicatilis]
MQKIGCYKSLQNSWLSDDMDNDLKKKETSNIELLLSFDKVRLRANIRKERILHIRSEAPSAQKKKYRRKERRQKI